MTLGRERRPRRACCAHIERGGHVDERESTAIHLCESEAELEGEPAPVFLGEPVGIGAGERANE